MARAAADLMCFLFSVFKTPPTSRPLLARVLLARAHERLTENSILLRPMHRFAISIARAAQAFDKGPCACPGENPAGTVDALVRLGGIRR